MQYIPWNCALLDLETLFLTQKGTFFNQRYPKSVYIATNLDSRQNSICSGLKFSSESKLFGGAPCAPAQLLPPCNISSFFPVRFPNPLTCVSGLENLTTFFLAYNLILKSLTLSNSLISTSSKRWWLAVGKTFNLLFSLLAWSEHKHSGHILILTLKFYCYLFDCFGCGHGWHARVIFWCCYQYISNIKEAHL